MAVLILYMPSYVYMRWSNNFSFCRWTKTIASLICILRLFKLYTKCTWTKYTNIILMRMFSNLSPNINRCNDCRISKVNKSNNLVTFLLIYILEMNAILSMWYHKLYNVYACSKVKLHFLYVAFPLQEY